MLFKLDKMQKKENTRKIKKQNFKTEKKRKQNKWGKRNPLPKARLNLAVPLPKDHRKPMIFIYINLHNGHVDLGNLGIYVNIYKGKPAKPHIHATALATTAAHQPISSL